MKRKKKVLGEEMENLLPCEFLNANPEHTSGRKTESSGGHTRQGPYPQRASHLTEDRMKIQSTGGG
jgi:hypothetical protein